MPNLLAHLKAKTTSYECIFVNFKSETAKWAKTLEGLIAMARLSIDVIQINGDMDKVEKKSSYAYSRTLFVWSILCRESSPQLLLPILELTTSYWTVYFELVSPVVS